jgi:hypothetical protein
MASGANQFQNQIFLDNFVNQQPVRFNMAFSHIPIIPGIYQGMISVFVRQRLLIYKQGNDLLQGFLFTTSLDRQLIILFKLSCKFRLKH